MTRALTKKLIETAIAAGTGGKPYAMLWDSNPKGLGLRIRQSGGASWLYRYRPRTNAANSAVTTLTLGAWPAMTPDTARKVALNHAAHIAMGGDPAEDLRREKLRARSAVGAALDDYELSLQRRHIVNCKPVMAILRRGFTPALSHEIDTLSLRDVVALIDRIAATKLKRKDGTIYLTPGTAAEFRKLAHGFLSWAALQGLTPANVLAGFRAPAKSREERRLGKLRQGRALLDVEIVAVWNATAKLGNFGALVRAGVLTGLRRTELAELRWSDMQGEAIVIPEGRTKMGREHRVPVSPAMRSLLATLPRSEGGLVFPSETTSSALAGWSSRQARLIRMSNVSFRLHDLRRTCRTLMSRLGVAEAVAEAAIGHTKDGLIATYDRHDWWDERIEAFEKVSKHILTLVNEHGSTKNTTNVVPIHSR